MPNSSRKQAKPKKPSKSFPLTAHNNGQWCKKIRSKIHFFGVWEDPQAALDNYLRVASDLHAGRQPSSNLPPDVVTVKDVCNHYLMFQLQKLETKQITPITFGDCRRAVNCLAQFIGSSHVVSELKPKDFERFRYHLSLKGTTGSGKGLGAHAQGRVISINRSMFKYAYEIDLIACPMKYGPSFEKPSTFLKRKTLQESEIESCKRAGPRTIVKHCDNPLGLW